MRHVYLILIAGVFFMTLFALAQAPGSGTGQQEEEEPLLLLDDEPEGDLVTEGGADNSRCHVCHMDFALEEIAVTHAKQDIGCGDCHGDCDAHIDDESWASGGPGTPPGIMYPREEIDPSCKKCHDSHDVPAREVLARWRERFPDKGVSKEVVCTDCHGRHKVNAAVRKAWWDKRTGEPIKP